MLPDQSAVDLVQVSEYIDWLRTTTPETVVEETCAHLAAGVPEDVLWAAGALVGVRYVNTQAHNLLGFVSHATIGCEDARRLAYTQDRRTHHLLLIQGLHQVVFDMYDPCLSPWVLLDARPFYDASLDENRRMLRFDVRIGEYLRVDHRLMGLAEILSRAELVDLLLDIGLEGMITDDHTLITPVLSLGMMELLGWGAGFDLLRCALRYSASFPRNFAPYDRALTLMARYGLENGAPAQGFQPDRVQALRELFLSLPPADRPEMAARALAEENCSAETVVTAVALAGCDMYLMTQPVPHEDFDAVSREVAPIHIGTSTDALRCGLKYMSPRTQALAALTAGNLMERGPSVLNESFEFVPFEPHFPYPHVRDVAALHGSTSSALLDRLRVALPAHDYAAATAAVMAYAESGALPEPLISVLVEAACMDDGTLLHSVKHLNAMVKEFYHFPLVDRWRYLAAAARFIAWYAGLNVVTYDRARAALGVGV